MNLIFSFLLLFLPTLLIGERVRTTRTYKVCHGGKCQSMRSLSPELYMNTLLFSPWSKWSRCSRDCSTYRYKACQIDVICGETVVQEHAFCYHRRSYCERVYQNSLQQERDDAVSSSVRTAQRLGYQPSSRNEFRDYLEDSPTRTSRRRQPQLSPSKQEQNAISTPARRRKPQTAEDVGRSYFDQEYKTEFPAHRNDVEDTENLRQTCGVARITDQNRHGISMRILGGREALKGRWPWQVAILNSLGETFCGGTLIAPSWILTAAHCVRRRIKVTIGEHDLHEHEGTEKSYRVETAFIHPNFDPETVDADIALLRLPEPVPTQAGTACLPQENQLLPATGTTCTILGWGKERYNHVFGTTVLHEGKVPIVSNAECRFTYGASEITSNMFCSGYRNGTVDSCAGDSGGPLLCAKDSRWTIFGVTSFGDGCGRVGKFGIYAKVPNYVRWINKVIHATESTRPYSLLQLLEDDE